MAEKKSFVFYYDWRDIFEPFDNETMGLLLRAVLSYAIDGIEPEFSDLALKISFNFIKSAFDRDKEKYNKVCQVRAENEKLGGRPKKLMVLRKSKRFQKKAKKADNDNENDNENDKIRASSFSKKTECV